MPIYQITFDQDVEQVQLEDALRLSGLPVAQVRATTPMTNGYAFADSFIELVWDAETGAEYCRCATDERKESHRPWVELTEEQQRPFLIDLTEFLDTSRSEYYEIQGLAETGLFDGIALQCDAYG